VSLMQGEPPHHMQWLWIGLAMMFVLIGASVFVSVAFFNGILRDTSLRQASSFEAS
jgi:hypothetical protein